MVPEVDVLLSDGTAVHLRPIRPQDAPSLVAMHSRFSERTRYLRYFSAHPRIPERELRRFVNVDHHDREALVIELGDRLIAVGSVDTSIAVRGRKPVPNSSTSPSMINSERTAGAGLSSSTSGASNATSIGASSSTVSPAPTWPFVR